MGGRPQTVGIKCGEGISKPQTVVFLDGWNVFGVIFLLKTTKKTEKPKRVKFVLL